MTTIQPLKWLTISLFWVLVSGSAFCQTFTVLSRTASSDVLRLDETLNVSFNVSATGLGAGVIPELVPIDPSHAENMSVTWNGTSATSNLSNLSFSIHLYDVDSFCNETISFQLRFWGPGFGPIAATEAISGLLEFETTGGGLIRLTDVIADTEELPYPLTGSSPRAHFLTRYGVTNEQIRDPNNRIYLWADHFWFSNFSSWSLNWEFFLWPMDGQGCSINPPLDMNDLAPIATTVPVIDGTGEVDVEVDIQPLGGGDDDSRFGEGINLWDVTDVTLSSCQGQTVRNSADYDNTDTIYQLYWRFQGFNTVVRRFGLYLGQVGGCQALIPVYGQPPGSSFQIDDFLVASNGMVEGSLNVPSAWASNGSLLDGLSVSWYLRSNTAIVPLGSTGRNLNINVASSLPSNNPQDYYLEARITDQRGQTVSVDNRESRRNYSYASGQMEFDNSESISLNGSGSDPYLDPGETVYVPLRILDSSSIGFANLSYRQGVVIDADGDGNLEPNDIFVTGDRPVDGEVNLSFDSPTTSSLGNVRTVLASYELLSAGDSDQRIWFFTDVTQDLGSGRSMTYRHFTSLSSTFLLSRDVNGEVTDETYNYDFSVGSEGWQAEGLKNGGGWLHQPADAFVGQGSNSSNGAADSHALTSPELPIGSDTQFAFRHLPQFSFNQSGGLLEYRTRTTFGSGVWGAWNNFVEDFCDSGCTSGYSQYPFPQDPNSYLSGKMVWMTNESAPAVVNVTVDDTLAITNESIQLRFIFADPSLVATGGTRSDGPTRWEVETASFLTTRLTEDNVFGINPSSLVSDACDDPQLTLLGSSPLILANTTFEWFENIDDLYDGIGTGVQVGASGLEVPFINGALGSYVYYVRVAYNSTVRIFPVTVNVTETCSNICLTTTEVQTKIRVDAASGSWPGVKNVTDCVIVVNQTCED